jgi:hypothetical protein
MPILTLFRRPAATEVALANWVKRVNAAAPAASARLERVESEYVFYVETAGALSEQGACLRGVGARGGAQARCCPAAPATPSWDCPRAASPWAIVPPRAPRTHRPPPAARARVTHAESATLTWLLSETFEPENFSASSFLSDVRVTAAAPCASA